MKEQVTKGSLFTIRAIAPADYAAIIDAHEQHYTTVEKFDRSFRSDVEKAIKNFKAASPPLANHAFVADIDGHFGGSIFCLTETERIGRIKLFYLIETLRGKGYGEELLEHALQYFKNQSFHQVMVSTYSAHTAACKLYKKIGFKLIESIPINNYGRDLVEQTWSLNL